MARALGLLLRARRKRRCGRNSNSFNEIASSHRLPQGLGPRQGRANYSRDLWPVKWVKWSICAAKILNCSCPLWVKSRHGTIKLRRPLYPRKRTWLSTAMMSALGHNRTHAAQQIPLHSITSSARASSEGGTVSPSVLAVLTLTAISNLAGS
jgi:hypothetical protein